MLTWFTVVKTGISKNIVPASSQHLVAAFFLRALHAGSKDATLGLSFSSIE